MKQAFEVRVREKVAPYKWVLKSKFYFAKDAGEARAKYRAGGQILRVEKVTKEKAQGIGSFFNLGDRLLREFADERAKEKGGEIKAKQAELALSGRTPDDIQKEELVMVALTKETKYSRRFNEQRSKTTH